MKNLFSRTLRINLSDGLSLVSTLWILTILSVLAMQLLYSFELENKAQSAFADTVKYHYAAKSGFELAIAKMRVDETNFDSLGETWAQPIEDVIDDGVHLGNFLTFQATITDEASRINVNTAPVETIRNLLLLSGAQPENNPTGDLASRIVEGRPYRTVRDVARVEGMTEQILYGLQIQSAPTSGSEEQQITQTELAQLPQLAQIATGSGGILARTTVHSIDSNTDTNGQQRVNINSANAEQIRGIRGNNNQAVFTQSEANAIIQSREFSGLGALLDVQAVSNQVYNNIRNRITIEENNTNNNGNGGGRGGNNNNNLVNINNADEDELEDLPGIDNGIAQRIVSHRDSQGNFQSIGAIRDVKVLTMQEFVGIVDKITTKDGQTVDGLININTASLEILQLLPGMDQAKAQAIITRREEENPETQNNSSEDEISGNPFSNISQLSDINEIDDQTFRQIVDWVTYRSRGYRIESLGIDATGKTLARCVGIVIREGNQLNVPYWRQD